MVVADDKKGDDATPNNTQQNRYSTNLLLSKFEKLILCTSENHRKRKHSRSSKFKLICKNAFSISPVTVTLKTLNLNKTRNNYAVHDGSGYKSSFNDFSTPLLELVSKTIFIFVVDISGKITG